MFGNIFGCQNIANVLDWVSKEIMKKKIHPKYFDKAVIKCSCGHSIKTGSTQENIEVEVCSACHPFYTGKQKLVDVAGRIDRFKKRLEGADARQSAQRKIEDKRSKKSDQKKTGSEEVKIG